jgi:hypothetical protein
MRALLEDANERRELIAVARLVGAGGEAGPGVSDGTAVGDVTMETSAEAQATAVKARRQAQPAEGEGTAAEVDLAKEGNLSGARFFFYSEHAETLITW